MTKTTIVNNAPEYPDRIHAGSNDSRYEQAREAWAENIAELFWPGCELYEKLRMDHADVFEFAVGEDGVGEVIYDHESCKTFVAEFPQDDE